MFPKGLKNKKILITGAKGFIGENLLDSLKRNSIHVETFNLSDGQDIQDENQLKKYVKKRFDVIFHLAGLSGLEKKGIDYFKINTIPSLTLCELLTIYSPLTHLILSGSRLEYGKPTYLPVDENHPTSTFSYYGLSKLAASQGALGYVTNKFLNATVLRTSNVYGPHLNKKFRGYNVINYFIDQAIHNGQIIIYGKGKQLRDYLYIDDLVDAFLLAADKSKGGIFNLGYGEGISIFEMANLITKTIGKGTIVHKEWPKNSEKLETGDYVTDISKIKKELGFIPHIDFESGIKLTLMHRQ